MNACKGYCSERFLMENRIMNDAATMVAANPDLMQIEEFSYGRNLF